MNVNSDKEFTNQQDSAEKRIEHLILLEDQLRNHISNLETIQKLLEQNASTTKDKDERIRTLKSISYNYDRIIKLYEVYQSYETAIQRYYSHLTDTIHKKYNIGISALKNNKQDGVSADFFRKLHYMLNDKTQEEIGQLTDTNTDEFDS